MFLEIFKMNNLSLMELLKVLLLVILMEWIIIKIRFHI